MSTNIGWENIPVPQLHGDEGPLRRLLGRVGANQRGYGSPPVQPGPEPEREFAPRTVAPAENVASRKAITNMLSEVYGGR
jgi:hypothetical protein